MTVAVPTATEISDRLELTLEPEEVEAVLAAEVADQASRCRVVPYAAPLAEALYRRVQRALAMRNLPLGVQMDAEGGIRVGSNDPEVRRLEAPYRRLVVG